ncbi:STAS domain-containing protein [uncultured Sphingomonas sp.]|uniref:STAS domain-containing protein n=1 Tax=uncultured Sphingomonas sp. TaxID=158754 RepID=UPI0025F34259|nr:STAS domain-containing protein [uncultured Sphingomonas sp.]
MVARSASAKSLTVRNITELYRDVVARYEAEAPIDIDLTSVEDVDLSLVQLLLVLRTAGAAAGREIRLRSPAPAPVAALLERAGFLAAATSQDLDFWFHGERAQ